jgi:hypothetical protein
MPGWEMGLDYSKIRQEIRSLRDEQDRLLPILMKPAKMSRGTISWHGLREDTEGKKRHASLVRTVAGKIEGRRIRDAHVGWLGELLDERRKYSSRLRRFKEIDKRIALLLSELRYENLYDYEPTVAQYLVRVEPSADGKE